MRRGGGTSPSQWEVIKPPTKELFAKVDPKATARRAAQEAATQQINDLSTRLGKLETNEATVIGIVNTLADQLTDALDRISRLEAVVDIRRDGDANGAAA
jgi:ABC-type transporter Mla subunit MlaD